MEIIREELTMIKTIVGILLVLAVLTVGSAQGQELQPKDYPPILGYYSPCLGGTDAEIFSWHGINQDGLPPVDLDRRSVDFLCVDKEVYAPYQGVVYGTTPRWGGLILIDDAEHGGCIVLLGMLTFEVEDGQSIVMGDFLGTYNFHVHIAVTDGSCEQANWYDWDARDLERPVLWTEVGEAVPSDILQRDAWPFVSENPAR
jgi:hypothetical protein